MTDDALAKLRARTPAPVVRDRQDRVDATFAPDARKARDIVRAVAAADEGGIHIGLADIAIGIAKVTADKVAAQALLERAETFVKAVVLYQREELQVSRPITWMGHGPAGTFGDIPLSWPEHKILLTGAWGALLRVVNEATKVGVQKKNRYAPISLLADPDAAPIQKATPEWT